MRDRESLIARIRHIRRVAKGSDAPNPPGVARDQDRLNSLQERVEHLESLVQGLQDSVHRESSRQAKRIADLENQIQPAALGKALSDDARARGL